MTTFDAFRLDDPTEALEDDAALLGRDGIAGATDGAQDLDQHVAHRQDIPRGGRAMRHGHCLRHGKVAALQHHFNIERHLRA